MNPWFLAFEGLMLLFLGLGLRHAARTGQVFSLLVGVGFGLLLEWATIEQLQAYRYGRFALMLGEVPVAIGIGWGLIVYSARLYSDATDLPEWARPLLDGLLALGMDLSMDVIAIRLGMWDWGDGLRSEYFGVPWGNFWAWFWVVSSFSAGLRLCRGRWWAPLAALAIGLVVVGGTNALLVDGIPGPWHPVAVAVEIGAALLIVWRLRPRLVREVPWLALAVPLVSHTFFLAAGLLSGAVFEPPVLLALNLAVFAASLWAHARLGVRWSKDDDLSHARRVRRQPPGPRVPRGADRSADAGG